MPPRRRGSTPRRHQAFEQADDFRNERGGVTAHRVEYDQRIEPIRRQHGDVILVAAAEKADSASGIAPAST